MLASMELNFLQLVILIIIILLSITGMVAVLIYVLKRRKAKSVTFEAIHITDLLKLIFAILSFVTVIISLVLLILQNRIIVTQAKFSLQSVESNVLTMVTANSLASDKIFVDNPEIRPYFYEAKDLSPEDPLYYQVCSVAEYLLDFFDSLESNLKKYPYLWIHEQRSWQANTVDMFAWSPILCRYLEATREWYSDELYALKVAGEKKRQAGQARQVLPVPQR